MDIFGMNQLSLTPFEISSEKVNSFPNQFTLEDTCFFTSGYESQIYNVSNIPIMRRQFYK